MQRWSARQLALWLSKRMDTEVSISSMRLGMLNRVVIDGVRIYDRQDTLMLDVARLAAKIELLPLLQKAVRIDNAQLFGAHAHFYKESRQAEPNFRFMLNAFASKDSTSHTRLDLQLDKFLVRGMSLRFDIHDQPETPSQINPSHLYLTDLRFNATLRHCTPDSINVELERLALQEKSGLILNSLSVNASAGRHALKIVDVSLDLPRSSLRIPKLELAYDSLPGRDGMRKWLAHASTCEGNLQASVTPSDIRAIVPVLKYFDDAVDLSVTFTGKEGTIDVQDISLSSEDHCLETQLQANLFLTPDSSWRAEALVKSLKADERFQPWLTRNLKGRDVAPTPILQRLGQAMASGSLRYTDQTLHADIDIHTELGKARIEGTLRHMNEVEAHLTAEQLQTARLLSSNGKSPLEELTASVHLKGFIKAENRKPLLDAEGTVERIIFKNYLYRNIPFAASWKGERIAFTASHEDLNGLVRLDLDLQRPVEGDKRMTCTMELANLDLHALNLTSGMEGERISMHIGAEMEGSSADRLNGQLRMEGLRLESEKEGTYASDRLTLNVHSAGRTKQMNIESPFLKANVDGSFHWQHLGPSLQQMMHAHLPQLFPTDSTTHCHEEMELQLILQDTTLIRRMAGIEMRIPQPATLSYKMNTALGLMQMQMLSPTLQYGGEVLRDINMQASNRPEMMQGTLSMRRIMKQHPIDVRLEAFAGYNKLRSVLRWDNNRTPAQKGSIDITGAFYKDADGTPMVQGTVLPTDITISDTLWKVHPASIVHRGAVTTIRHLGISQDKRHLSIGGVVSREESDTLTVDLNQINLAYIFQMINFKGIEFSGNATGRIYAQSLLAKPRADAFLQVEDFRMNQSYMGEMDVHAGWGHADKSIQLDADIRDAKERSRTMLQGTITPGHEPGSGLNLHINAKRINMAFLNKYTSTIFTGLQGRATGTARVFGPFKQIDLEGDLLAEEASMKVNMLGTTYRMYGDSVTMRPGIIRIHHATAYDDFGSQGNTEHSATVDGRLMHHHLGNLRYEFNIEARNLLSYDFRDFDDQTFYGTFFASGNVHLSGQPGELTVDVNATPQAGSQLVYNVGSPETITEAGFISFVSPGDSVPDSANERPEKDTAPQEEEANDIRLNMDLDITPQATVKLLMDPKSGDHILLGGNGHIRAHYYNKGKFQMYGVYRVNNGVYKLSLQDFIHKDFTFREGSTITFGGDAFQAALNLQAIYTVPNVSLDDLSTSTLGLSNTRVDCVMNITGQASAPAVSFDFDLPGANEDEKQMVRSMVSTEEEKNMQAMYLLGIGRFYNNSAQYASGGSQSSMAMNSLISSTLSSQFNQMMSNMVGNSNWTFGANLRTGETGWNELDVEGMLSGRLLGNRLLLNGNFGYRESVYSNNNFIGDFDVKYLITPGGTVALRAYNETNDRYFIQSSLTTQGIGLQFKKDFNRWRDIFRKTGGKRRRRKQ